MVHWNGTVYDTVFPSMWYLDRTDIQEAEKTQYPIDLSSSLITKIWDLEKMQGESGYIVSVFADTSVGAQSPIKPLEVYYLNESYDPTGDVAPEDSPYAFYLTSYNATSWVDHAYEPHANASYIKGLFINESAVENAGVDVMNTGWLYFKSQTPAVKPYYINVTNAESSTNRTFGETNVSYSGTSAPFSEYLYTPNIFLDFTHDGHQFKMQLYAADNNGLWANSTIETTDIGVVDFPPTTPAISHFHYPTIDDDDYDMNGTYHGTFWIGVGLGTDPDGGTVTHNLTLHYANETFVAIINNTFTEADLYDPAAPHAAIEFDSSPYYSGTDEYTLRVVATDDEGDTTSSWLMENFTLRITDFYGNVSQNVTISEDVDRESSLLRSIDQFLGITDAISRLLESFRDIPQSLGISEEIDKLLSFFRGDADAFGVVDAITRVYKSFRSDTDTLGISDAIIRKYEAFRSAVETIDVIDAITKIYSAPRDVSQSLGVTDSISKTMEFFKNVAQGVGVTDTVEAAKGYLRGVVDIITITVDISRIYIVKGILTTIGLPDWRVWIPPSVIPPTFWEQYVDPIVSWFSERTVDDLFTPIKCPDVNWFFEAIKLPNVDILFNPFKFGGE